MDEAPGALQRRGSLTARLRNEVPTASTRETRALVENDGDKDGFPCPRQIKPLLYFYKYLQPLPDGRKLQLQMPPTVVCDKKDGCEEILALHTDVSGCVVKEASDPAWRKHLLSDFMGEDQQNAASLLTVGMDDVVAVRNVVPWKSLSTGSASNESLVLTRRAFDVVVSAPCERAFSVQKYVRCRGSHASIFRVTWGERENRRFAINIFNEKKITEAPAASSTAKTPTSDGRPQGTPFDAALRQMAQLSSYYLVTGTSGSDPKRLQQHAKLPRIRGNPVADALDAVRRMIEHFTAQLPGIKVRELTADFMKDGQGRWWFIRVTQFDAYYRIEVPLSVQTNSNIDSAAFIHDALRSKYFRQTLRTIAAAPPGNRMVPQCSLCGCSCELPKAICDELNSISLKDSTSDDVFRVVSDYRMTLKMVVSTLFQLRQRGMSLALWEHAALLLLKNPVCQSSEFTVCYLCYRIYKSHLALSRVAQELNEAYGVARPSLHSLYTALLEGSVTTDVPGDSRCRPQGGSNADRITALCSQIDRVHSETCVSIDSSMHAQLARPQYTPVKGLDVDPTCLQLRLVFFFHELQDGGPAISAGDFYLEYHLGQHFSRLDFDGSKRHTPNRWQLCEARVHYLLATTDSFGDYCNEKRIQIKMKTVTDSEYHGHTFISLRPLLSAAKWYSPSVQRESRADYLLELKTDAFGLLTLKVTLGLLVDPVPLGQVRELIKDEDYLRDDTFAVFWPPPWFQSCSLPVPVDWVGALMPSEYISILPRHKRQNGADRRRIGLRRGSASNMSLRKLEHDGKSPSMRFSVADRIGDGSGQHQHEHLQSQSTSSVFDPLDMYADVDSTSAIAAQRMLVSVCMVARRVVYRVAGEVSTFPTVLIGHILRHARYLSPARCSEETASWTEQALFHLTARDTIDSVSRDIDIESTAALSVVGEMLLVLTRCHLVPASVSVAKLERTIGPYWLVGLCGYTTHSESLKFEPVSLRVTSVSSQQRMVWNRAIRRCQVAHFCGEFRPYARAACKPDEQDRTLNRSVLLSKYEEMQALQRRMSYRVKMQAHVLCEIVEMMEADDSGTIDIAELRSLHKCMHAARETATAPSKELSFHDRDRLDARDLEALSILLEVAQETTEAAFVECLMNSDRMADALSQFDRFGAGTKNFDEFWELGDTVLKDLGATFASEQDEPRCTVFCLRHGTADAFAVDRCCVLCAVQYQDQEFLLRPCLNGEGSESSLSESDSDAVSEAESREGNDEAELPQVISHQKELDVSASMRGPRTSSLRWPETAKTNSNDEPLNQITLATTLQQLRAAEWHVRHSHNTLDRAAVETLRTDHRSPPGPRASTPDKSVWRSASSSSFAVTDFVAEAEHRKHQALSFNPPEISQQRITRTSKKKSNNGAAKANARKSRSVALRSTRLQNAHSLSTLLRMELDDSKLQGLRSGGATRTTRLIDTVHKGETKRTKLDRLVLAELDDVKQRLARLLASS